MGIRPRRGRARLRGTHLQPATEDRARPGAPRAHRHGALRRLQAGGGVVPNNLIVRLVPISADQMRVLESLQRAFFGLAADVNRDLGVQDDDSIAGGLYRVWSTLGVIATLWKEQAEDAAAPERWRRALAAIANDAPIDDARSIARTALAVGERYE